MKLAANWTKVMTPLTMPMALMGSMVVHRDLELIET
jgi:hypothetical protein